jgi:hypothetical protein
VGAGRREANIKLRMVLLLMLIAVLVPLGTVPGAAVGHASPADGSKIYLPLVSIPPPALVLFADDFEGGIARWTPFVNYWRLEPEQWYHDKDRGYGIGHGYAFKWSREVKNPDRGGRAALTMVLGPEAQGWTDYRLRVRFRAESGRQAGVWFRGAYREVEAEGQWLTGYYFTVDVRPEGTGRAELGQLRTTEEHGNEADPAYWYYFDYPLSLVDKELTTSVNTEEWHEITVEVRGPHIKCYVDDELAADYVDQEGSIFLKGTIGLYVYGSDPRYAYVRFDDVLVERIR